VDNQEYDFVVPTWSIWGQAFTIGELTPILETLKTEIRAEFKSQLGEIVTVVQDQGTQIDEMKSEMNISQKWTRLVVAQQTCAQLQLLSLMGEGFDGRKELIDPDGKNIGYNPIEVECKDGDTTAGKVFQVDVPQCSGQYCFKFVVPLPENDLAQMKNLVDRSLECAQQIEIKCLGAPLQFNGENLFQLTDYSGRNQSINTKHACDAKSSILIQTSMDITDKAILPLRGFFYGPLDVAGQKFSVKIGKLICKANFTYEESLSVKNRLSVLEEKIEDQNTKIADNSAKFGQNKAKIGTNKETIDKINVNINSNVAKLTNHDGRIVTNNAGIKTNKGKIDDHNRKIADNNAKSGTNEAKITENLAKFGQNEARIKTNKETIDTINTKINSNKLKLTNHDGRIVNNYGGIEINKGKIETNENSINNINVKVMLMRPS